MLLLSIWMMIDIRLQQKNQIHTENKIWKSEISYNTEVVNPTRLKPHTEVSEKQNQALYSAQYFWKHGMAGNCDTLISKQASTLCWKNSVTFHH